MFSKHRLVSIGLLLAILFISLTFMSYVEGLENASIVDIVNKDAPQATASAKDAPQATASAKDAPQAKASATASAKDAPQAKASATASAKASATASAKDAQQAKTSATASAKDAQPIDGVTLGKPLTVADITGVLQNNPGVQKLLDKSL